MFDDRIKEINKYIKKNMNKSIKNIERRIKFLYFLMIFFIFFSYIFFDKKNKKNCICNEDIFYLEYQGVSWSNKDIVFKR